MILSHQSHPLLGRHSLPDMKALHLQGSLQELLNRRFVFNDSDDGALEGAMKLLVYFRGDVRSGRVMR